MALSKELINLKSAGTYRFEEDRSQISNDQLAVQNLRLLVGFSKKGPFNTPVLVTNSSQFTKLFGDIDRSLEKRGSYFHRSCLTALSAGPILALNLLNLDPDLDQVPSQTFSVNSLDSNKDMISLPLLGLYNTDKFYEASAESYLDTIQKYLTDDASHVTEDYDVRCANEILHFANIGKKPISILVVKSNRYNTTNYELTLNDWYGKANVPEYLNGTSYVSDYFVDVYVVEGNFGPTYVANPIDSAVDIDDDGTPEVLNYYKVKDDGYNGYGRFISDVVFQDYFDKDGFIRKINPTDTTDTRLTRFLNLPSVKLIAKYTGCLIPNFIDKLGSNLWIQKLINDDTSVTGLLCVENIEAIEKYTEFKDEEDVIGESIDIIGNNLPARILKGNDGFNLLSYKVTLSDGSDSDLISDDICTAYTAKRGLEDTIEFGNGVYVIGDLYTAQVDDEKYKVRSGLNYIKDNEAVTSLNENGKSDIVVGDYILSGLYVDSANEENICSRTTRVNETRYLYHKDENTNKFVKVAVRIVASDKVLLEGASDEESYYDANTIYVFKELDTICDHLQWITLSGLKVREECMPNGTNERQNVILDMIRENPEYKLDTQSNLFKTLIDRDYIQWRYLVDTFGYGIEEESKKVYTLLCAARKSALAIVNCPSQLDFKKSVNPSFVNVKGSVEAEFIAKGGDTSKSPAFLYSLPSFEDKASWGAYYYPYLKIMDQGAVKIVPPAAYVSNLYLNKYNSAHAWSIVAGQKRGVISGNQVVGVEATLVHDNRDWLEPAGINSIIWQNGVGVEIYANKTAQQTPKSALSSAHVRECCIYIQDTVEEILRRYVFEQNTAQTRLEIKTLVDNFLNGVQSDGGIYAFKTVMDTSNNTPEVIDANMGVIDLFIEPVRGMEILVQKLTILRTGAIESGALE